MFVRDIERLARSLFAQKCETDYVRHYLMETYQIDKEIVDKVFERIGVGHDKSKGRKSVPAAKPDPQADRRKRQGF